MLETKELTVSAKGGVLLLQNVTLALEPGQAVGLTGQSGAGKTTLLRALLGLLNPGCRVTGGEIWIDDKELSQLSKREQRQLRGITLGFIPQNPMTSFDSRMKIGAQMAETLRLRADMSKAEAGRRSRMLLEELGIEEPDRVMNSLPGQLSGGQLQRVTVALLLALKPKYILADEPTSALDEENRRLLLDLLAKQSAGILFISHDVAALKRLCSIVHVMESGQITESASMTELLDHPTRAWTKQFAAAWESPNKEGWIWTD